MQVVRTSGSEKVANSGALAASLIASANPSRLYSVTGYNSSASDQYIQVHDTTSVPANGAVPKLVLVAYAGTAFSFDFPTGRICATGITICNSSTAATKTLGSADCLLDCEYRQIL